MNTPPAVLLLDRNTLDGLLDIDECIAAVEAAFAAHDGGRSFTPAMSHVAADGGEFHVKSGGLRGGRAYFACKVNGSFFQNRARFDLPNIIGLIVLSDASDGRPLAVMESGLITRLRTGAATAVAAKYLARPESATVTVCGAGLQGAIQLRALTRVLPIRNAWIWSRDPKRAQALVESSRDLGIEIDVAVDLAGATRTSDVVVTCTAAAQWFLAREHIRPGTFVAAVGADGPGKQELEPSLVATSAVVCDLIEQCAHVGELQHALAQGLLKREQLRGSLGAVITGRARGRVDAHEITLFDSTGTALQDAAAAALVYEQAVAKGLGSPFAFWG